MRRTSIPRATIVRTALAAATGTLLVGLTAAPALAAPGDPAVGWASRPEEAHREVAVSDTGRVFVDANAEGGYKPVYYLETGYFEEWVRTSDDGGKFASHLATGPNNYAVRVAHSQYRLYNSGTWSDPITFYDGQVSTSEADTNSAGDISVLMRLDGAGGGTAVARLPRGGEWTVQELPGVPNDIPAGIALNEQGKTTVVWATPSGERSTVLRSVVHEGRTDWSTPQTVGIVNDPAPNLSIATDGEGRETVIGGNQLWRQPSTSRPLEYRMRTSIYAKLATGDSATRVVWPARTDTEFEIRSVLFDDDTQRPQATLWSYPRNSCTDSHQLNNVPFGVGMVPGGRSYVAVGINRSIDSTDPCPDVATFLPVDRTDRVLNEQPLGYFTNGQEFQVAAGAAGPIAVEFKNWDNDGDPMSEDQPDGLYSMSFFQR